MTVDYTPKRGRLSVGSKSPSVIRDESARVSRSTRKWLNKQSIQPDAVILKDPEEYPSGGDEAILQAISTLEDEVNNTFINIEEKLLRTVKNLNKDKE